MRFIQKWSYGIAKYVAAQTGESHAQRQVYYFGAQIVIASIVKGLLLIGAALITSTLIPTLVVVATFVGLRVLAGGYHMDTYGKCAAASVGLFVLSGCIAQYTHKLWNNYAVTVGIFIILMLGVWIILKWAPRDTPNRPITNPQEHKKFRMFSLGYLGVWGLIAAGLQYNGLTMLVLASCLGVLNELFVITPAGHKFFDMISGKMDSMKKK